nr:MAG: SCO family protein [Hyphomicrobiales bacterium]
MPAKTSPSLALMSILLAGAVAAGSLLWGLGKIRREGGPIVVTTGEAEIGGPFSLIDQNGIRRSDQDFRGRYMLVFFGFTYCPDICPTTLAVLSAALNDIGPLAEDIVPIFISVDPERDTPGNLKPYLAAFGSQFVGLTGTREETDNAVGVYRAYYRIVGGEGDDRGDDYLVDHTSIIYLMDREGKFVTNYDLNMGPGVIAADLRKRIR